MNGAIHVVKVGGSLLTQPGLADALTRWIASGRDESLFLVAGGGPLVDGLREIDRAQSLSEADCHWLAVDAMDVTACILHAILPHAVLVDDWTELQARSRCCGIIVAKLGTILRDVEPSAPGTPLSIGWQTTSDSIAARLAELVAAPRLTLLKATSWPAGVAAGDWAAAARAGFVDGSFAGHAASIPNCQAVCLSPCATLSR